MENASKNFDAALASFVVSVQKMTDDYMEKNGFNWKVDITAEAGRRYVRIIKSEKGSHRSVHCFVDKTNGNVLKAESWKKPARHARGNIYDANPLAGVTPHGACYMR